MVEGQLKKSHKGRKIILNVVYSTLVFLVLFSLGIGILDPSSLEDANNNVQPSGGAFFVFAASVALTIVFSIWYGKWNKR